MCKVFDQISVVRGLDGAVFIYGFYSTSHIVSQLMVTYTMEGPAKTVMLEKLGLVKWIKISIFIKLFGKKRPHHINRFQCVPSYVTLIQQNQHAVK